MTDKELLELAAKAAGIEHNDRYGKGLWVGEFYSGKEWNPLTNDGDALRLAVKLRLRPVYIGAFVACGSEPDGPNCARLIQEWIADHKGDELAATRRAIVRAAAEIGKEMK